MPECTDNHMRKLILLFKDRHVEFTKKSVSQLLSKNKLARVRWVLIPIQTTSATYIAVEASKIMENPFDMATIRYHLRYKRSSKLNQDWKNVTPDGVGIAFDYMTTSVIAATVEDLYQAIYNMMVFKYIRTAVGSASDGDEYWFMDLEDVSVTLTDKDGKKIDFFQVRHRDFLKKHQTDYDASLSVYEKICEHFGLHYPEKTDSKHTIWETERKLTFELSQVGLIWEEHTANVGVYTRVKYVGIQCAETRAFTILTDIEYDQALRMRDCAVFITPISLYECTHPYPYLPICNFYGMPKYEFYPDIGANGMDDSGPDMLYNDFTNRVYDILTFYIYSAEDIAILLDNSVFLMQVLFEGCKIWTASEASRSDIENMEYQCTLYLNLSIELTDGSPTESSLTIHTDVFEDYPPNIKEVAYLLRLQEHGSAPF